MKFRIRTSPAAEQEALAAFDYIAAHAPLAAANWYDAFWRAIESLERFPRRCRLAPEAETINTEVRQFVVGSYRVLFIVSGDSVVVVHVRHAARRPLRRSEFGELSNFTN